MRIVSWNISAARYASIAAIADELRAMRADLVALQEVDHRLRRSGMVDQAGTLATRLGLHQAFAASIKWDGGDYGLAVLSRWPIVAVRRHRLDVVGVGEPRIVLEVSVCANGRPLTVFNHHSDVSAISRQHGLPVLARLVKPQLGRGVLVVGDFNEPPTGSAVGALMDAGLVDLHAADATATTPGGRLDYILADQWLSRRWRHSEVWVTTKSDHHAVVAEVSDARR
jgi:endonuclease/exonuclease/phosphatase family metal-dependent hydrolase